MNTVIIAGNLTRDPELRYTQNGKSVCEFSLAVNRKWKSDTGDEKEEVSFFDCAAFARTAEVITEFYRKGGRILVEGELRQERWDDKQTGQPRSKVKIIVARFEFMGRNGGDGDGSTPSAPKAPSRQTAAPATEASSTSSKSRKSYDDDDDNVPF